ncbi:MAG: SCP2 sterol-binding domain-containing protein [Alphaproteobacteria bacterium]|nr:SCP2 sterol-binding domain-containing protein [Alphaproteobacteria bacterium]
MGVLVTDDGLMRRETSIRLPAPLRRSSVRTRLRSASLRLALTASPMLLLDAGLALTVRTIARRHRGLVARLAPSAGARILIEIADIPCALLLTIEEAPRLPSLRLATGADRKLATASVAGQLSRLVELLDGDVDGDTMFFSRDLSISSDTSAILLLRNALDSEDIDLFDDMLGLLGPFAKPARRIRQTVAAVAQGVERRTASRRMRRLAAAAGSNTPDEKA